MVHLALVLAMSPWATAVGAHGEPGDAEPPIERGDDEGDGDGDGDGSDEDEGSSLRDALDDPDRKAEARAAFGRGVQAYKDEDFEKAVEEFSRAQQLASHPDTLFNLALAQQKVGDHIAAWKSLDALLELTEDEQDREDIRDAQDNSRPHVSRVQVVTQHEGVICFDGRPMPTDEDGVPGVLTTPGPHRIDVDRAHRGLELEGGEYRTLAIDLPPPQPPPLPRRRLRVLAGLSLASTGAAAGLGLGAALTESRPVRVGLGIGAAGSGALALTTSVIALLIHRRAKRWTPPPPLRRCPP